MTDTSPAGDPLQFILDVVNSASTPADRLRLVKFAAYLDDWVVAKSESEGNIPGVFTEAVLKEYKFSDLFTAFLNKGGYVFSSPTKDSVELHAFWYSFDTSVAFVTTVAATVIMTF